MIFNEMNFLKRSNLVEGNVYVFKDGRVAVYMGVTASVNFAFYHLFNIPLVRSKNSYRDLVMLNETNVLSFYVQLGNKLMSSKCNPDCFIVLSTFPKLYDCAFEGLDFSNTYFTWYQKNCILQDLKLVLKKPNIKVGSKYLSIKDLKVGHVYIANSYGEAYVYLGRWLNWLDDRVYLYVFIGNATAYNNSPEAYMSSSFYTRNIIEVKSPKKLLRDADNFKALDEKEVYHFCINRRYSK